MMEVFGKMYMHIASNGNFEGFGVDGFRNRLFTYTYPVTVIEQPVFEAPINITIPVPQPVAIQSSPALITTSSEQLIMGSGIQYDRATNVVIDGSRRPRDINTVAN
jgi:hypothetical protein